MAEGTAVAVKAVLANGEIARFTLRFDNPAGQLPIADLQDVADAAQTAYNLHDDLYCADIEMGLCTAQSFDHAVDGSGNPYWRPVSAEVLSSVAGVDGTAAGQSASPQVALAVTLRTALAGSSFRGRVFTFPPPEAQVEANGTVTDSGARADMVQDIVTAVEAVAVAGGALKLEVFSALLDSSEEVIGIVANSRVDTQRRRLQR